MKFAGCMPGSVVNLRSCTCRIARQLPAVICATCLGVLSAQALASTYIHDGDDDIHAPTRVPLSPSPGSVLASGSTSFTVTTVDLNLYALNGPAARVLVGNTVTDSDYDAAIGKGPGGLAWNSALGVTSSPGKIYVAIASIRQGRDPDAFVSIKVTGRLLEDGRD